MTGRRRLGMIPPARPPQGYVPGPGKVVLVDGIPEGAITRQEPVSAPTLVVTLPPPALTQAIDMRPLLAEGQPAEPYTREPVPDRDSLRAADRQEFLDAIGGTEPLFSALVTERDAAWLTDASLPVPPRTAAEDVKDPGSGTVPPAGDGRDETAPVVPDPVSTEDEPVAEPDCAETGDVA